VATGVFIDNVVVSVAAARADVEAKVRRTLVCMGAITLMPLLLVFASGLFLNIRQLRLADAKLKALTQRAFDAQKKSAGAWRANCTTGSVRFWSGRNPRST